jgi:Tfp pilus assembly protein PilF
VQEGQVLFGQKNGATELQEVYGENKLWRDITGALKISDSHPDSAINVINVTMPMLVYSQDSLRGMCFFVLGEAFYAKSDYTRARRNYTQSVKLFLKTNDEGRLATAYNNLGLSYYLQANYDSAMIAFENSLRYETKLNNREGIAKSYQNMGLVLYQMDENDKAFSYMERALHEYEKIHALSRIAEVANNLAIAYIDKQDYDKAYFYYIKALKSFENDGDIINQANVLANLGSLYYYKHDFIRAMEFLNRALDIFKAEDEPVGQIHVRSRMGDVYMADGEMDKALGEFLICEQMNKSIEIRDVRINNLKSLTEAYRKMHLFEDALRTSDQYHALQDSVYNQEKYHAIMDVEQKYETHKTTAELYKIKAREKWYLTLFIGSLVVLLLLIGLVILWRRNIRVKERQRLMLLEQRVLRTQMNPHFLFNALSTIQYYVLENQMVEAIDYLGDFSKLIRMVLQSSQEEYVTIETERAILEYYLSLQVRRFENKFSYIIHVDDEIKADKVLIPPMLAQPFIENLIEMSKLASVNDGQLWISFSLEGHKLVYRVQDNGLYKINTTNNRMMDHVSMTLMMTRERIKLINEGDPKQPIVLSVIDLSKSGKSGNLIEFSIPLHKIL